MKLQQELSPGDGIEVLKEECESFQIISWMAMLIGKRLTELSNDVFEDD